MKNKILITILLLSFTVACSDDFLNLKNPNSQDTGLYFKTQNEIDQAVVAIYSGMFYQGLWARDWYYTFDFLGNEATALPPCMGDLVEIAAGSYNASNSEVTNTWRSLYRIIVRSQFVLSKLDNWTPEKAEYIPLKKRYEGEARFFIGMSYYYLAALYGDVPLHNSYAEMTTNLNLGRSDRSKVFEYATDQLTQASILLPNRYTGDSVGHVTSWAAKAYIGMAHLQQGHFDKAQPVFEDIVQNGGFSAWDGTAGFSNQFLDVNRTSPESIWQVLHKWWSWGDGMPFVFWGHWEQGWGSYKSSAPSARGMEYGFDDWQNADIARSVVYNFKYDIASTSGNLTGYIDPRAALTFYGDGGYGGKMSYFAGAYPFDTKSWRWRKYQHYEERAKEDLPSSGISTQIVRLHTVRLMLAECYIMQGNYNAALEQINLVRRRVGAKEYASLPAKLGTPIYILPNGKVDPKTDIGAMSILMREKSLELCGEQQRWFDLIRWNYTWPGFNMAKQLNFEKGVNEVTPALTPEPQVWSNKDLLFPIPQGEKDVNHNIVVTDGWNGTDLSKYYKK